MTDLPLTPDLDPQPDLGMVFRLLEQGFGEQQKMSEQAEMQAQIVTLRLDGFQKSLEGAIDLGKAEMVRLTHDTAGVRSRVDTIEEHVGFLTRKVAEHDKRFDQVDARLDRIEERLDGHDARLDGIDARLDGIDARLDGIDARLDGIDTRLDGINTQLDGINTQLDKIDERFDALAGMTSQILEAVRPRAE